MAKTDLTPEEKLRVAHAVLINGLAQHHVASLFAINQGRVNEAVTLIKDALGWKEEY